MINTIKTENRLLDIKVEGFSKFNIQCKNMSQKLRIVDLDLTEVKTASWGGGNEMEGGCDGKDDVCDGSEREESDLGSSSSKDTGFCFLY